MTVDTTRVEGIEVRWTPDEVLSIHTAGLRDLEADPAAPYVPGIERDCAMSECERPAEGSPLLVDVAPLPAPVAVDLCAPCREPFVSGMEAIERLATGDGQASPYRFAGRGPAELEAER